MIKYLKIFFFNFLYGKIHKVFSKKKSNEIKVEKVNFNKKHYYNIYHINRSRNFIGSVHDFAVIIDNEVFNEGSYQYRFNKRKLIHNASIKKNIVFEQGTPTFAKKIDDNILSLLSGGAAKNNYFHWLFDVLPRIAIYKKSKKQIKDLKYLLPSTKLNYQLETLKKLKVDYKSCYNSKKLKHFISKKLVIVDHPYVFNNNPDKSIQNIPLWIIRWLKREFKSDLKKNFYDKIYIDRADSKFYNIRNIINENEIKKYLISAGFKTVVLSDFSFQDQVNLFKFAKIIIGPHGAGFANLVFSKPKTKVIELQSMQGGNVIKNLALKCRLKYYRIVSNTRVSKRINPHGSIHIDINKLKKII